jgi:predicted nucleotide-binding protein (sugar kinase/HSP70/actin superfamily)
MSDNICYPAKLAHAHILNLLKCGVDRIFYPRVTYEQPNFTDAANSYNCPIVTGYPDVIDSAVNPAERGTPMDSPLINFKDRAQLRSSCKNYLSRFAVGRARFNRAFD